MKLETFFENFDLLSDAPNAVVKFRQLILELAVRGMLVPQDSEDEPVELILKRIRQKKSQLLKERKIKKIEQFPSIEDEEVLYEIPSGWKWARFGDVTICRDGDRIPVSSDERASRRGIYDYYGASGIIDKIDDYLFDQALLLIGEDGANLINRSTPIAFIATGKYWVNNHAHVLDSDSIDCLKYLETFINAIDLKPYVTGTAQPKMNQAKMNSIPVSLPPLPEQKRIVEKCDRLMTLCDQIEQRQQERQKRIVTMNEGAIAQLLSAQNPDEFTEHWNNICNNFDLLYSIPETVPKLRQAILQLAVMGKLVRQEPGDEPANILLKGIRTKGQELFQEGTFRKYKNFNSIALDEMYFDLPMGWCWAKLGEMGEFLGGGTPSKSNPDFWDGNIPWVSPKDMKTQYIFDSQDHISAITFDQSSVQPIPAGCLLMVVRGMILSHSFPVALTKRELAVNQDMKVLNLVSKEVSEYLLRACQALRFRMLAKVSRSSHGTCKLAFEDVENFLVPLPPLAEQKRIVAKVDRLMSLCDALEAKLQEVRGHSEKLVEVAARQVLAS